MLILKIMGLLSRVMNWILYFFAFSLLPIFLLLLLSLHYRNFMLWLSLCFQVLFCIPEKYRGWEYRYRAICLFLSVFPLIIYLVMERIEFTFLLLPISAIICVVLCLYLHFSHKIYMFPFLMTDIRSMILMLIFIHLLVVGGIVVDSIPTQHLFGCFSLINVILMLSELSASARRSKIIECIGDIKKIKIRLEEVCGDMKKTILVKTRFEEFLEYIEKGNLEYAYIVLSTGLSEVIGVWEDKKNKKPKFNGKTLCHTHEQLRGAIVHSLPKRKEIKKINKDAEERLKVYKEFKKSPFIAICDLLNAIKTKIEKIHPLQRNAW